MKKSKDQFYKGKGICPHCAKRIEIVLRRITTKKPEKGVYEIRQILEKDAQTELPKEHPNEAKHK